MNVQNRQIQVSVIQIVIVIALALLWEALGKSSRDIFFFIGSPSAVFKELIILVRDEHLIYHFGVTGSEALLGLMIGTLVGAATGLLLWYSETVTKIAKPFVLALGTLPIFAFAPLMIVWFGIGFKMKVALAAFSTVFVAFNQANRGARNVFEGFVDSLRGMDATKQQIFKIVIIPGSIDWLLSSMRLNVGFGLLGAFIGEFIASQAGLGYLILRAGGLYNVPRAFAAALGIAILALAFDAGASYIERKRHILVQLLSVPRSLW